VLVTGLAKSAEAKQPSVKGTPPKEEKKGKKMEEEEKEICGG